MSRARQLLGVPTPGLFLGAQLAVVEDLNDPDNRLRVKIRLLASDGVADHDGPVWARVACPFAGDNRGTFFIPEVGDEVLIAFVQGDPRFPIVLGGLWNGATQTPAAISGGKNYLKVIRSKNGVKITLDDHDGQEQLIVETPGGQKITLKDGPSAITIEDSNSNSLKFESSGVTLTAASKLTINAPTLNISSSTVSIDSASTTINGATTCSMSLTSPSVVGSTYTPGAGNIW